MLQDIRHRFTKRSVYRAWSRDALSGEALKFIAKLLSFLPLCEHSAPEWQKL